MNSTTCLSLSISGGVLLNYTQSSHMSGVKKSAELFRKGDTELATKCSTEWR
jgi:hypothetical protein